MMILSETETTWAVIFDLDGLLVDSEPVQKESFNVVLSRYGVRLEEDDFRPLVGHSTRENFEYLKKRFGICDDVDTLLALKAEAYEGLLWKIKAMPGALELVEKLYGLAVPMAVASSSSKDIVLRSLAQAGFDNKFDVVVGGDEVAMTKPAPDVYLRAVSLLKIPPKRCVALEDSRAGVRAARSSGLRCIAVPNKYTSEEDLKDADLVLPSLLVVDADLIRRLALRLP